MLHIPRLPSLCFLPTKRAASSSVTPYGRAKYKLQAQDLPPDLPLVYLILMSKMQSTSETTFRGKHRQRSDHHCLYKLAKPIRKLGWLPPLHSCNEAAESMSRTKFAARKGRGLATMITYTKVPFHLLSGFATGATNLMPHMSRLSKNLDNQVIRNASINKLSTMLCQGPVRQVEQHWLARLHSMYKIK